jgi:hypothetical protein
MIQIVVEIYVCISIILAFVPYLSTIDLANVILRMLQLF